MKKNDKKCIWIARDRGSGTICAFKTKPIRYNYGIFMAFNACDEYIIPRRYESLFDELTWENSPIKIHL